MLVSKSGPIEAPSVMRSITFMNMYKANDRDLSLP